MTDEQREKLVQQSSEPPYPLDFPIKDPLRETYEGRWQQLPVIQKVGCDRGARVLVFVYCRTGVINTILVFATVMTILGAFFLLLRRHIR
jgi:hypothetical protein